MMLYNGPSRIDGAPIFAWATGYGKRPSVNRKTGPMIQVWIMRRDVRPGAAVRSGDDRSICGGCRHRGLNGAARTCYVSTARGPATVWDSADRAAPSPDTRELAVIGAGQHWRIGAYGDPAAVPLTVWRALTELSAQWTGYTHQWRGRLCRDSGWRSMFLASVDSPAERDLAQSRGWRTFRVRRPGEPAAPNEKVCPAELGASSCFYCGLCGGGRSHSLGDGKGIVVHVHGQARGRF